MRRISTCSGRSVPARPRPSPTGWSASWARLCPARCWRSCVAISLSPLSPLGPIRARVPPGPAIAFDWTVLGFGLLVLIGGLGAIAVALAYRGAPHRLATKSRIDHPRDSRLLQMATSSGLSASGCRRSPLRSPVRSWPHLGPGPLRARGRHLGRGLGDHDTHVQQRTAHLGVTPRTVRVELELRADLGKCRPPTSPRRPQPRP